MQFSNKHKENFGFQRLISVDSLKEDQQHLLLEAELDECKELARRFSVVSVERLNAEIWAWQEGERSFRARVQFSADVVQSCVVTLDPVLSNVRDTFELSFLPSSEIHLRYDEADEADEERGLDFSKEEPPEEIIDGNIDLGGVVAEYLSLAINPYPRKQGVDLAEWSSEIGVESRLKSESPFETLKNWRGKP